ncbi:hypothetical protein FG167_09310 [Lacinutrix sp. WUR7]|uniref:hypothetical protein n=1 Tax=Lacinutrix sp. WUR7 TaxID=2653681 RepID=UPI00193E291F|nr:hypothetical protein [Lacinutrix sp. WUR7]QRM89428.1 hypothetical protein FG167_09310 [Lacinutrix sp. WUR7]
MKTNFSLTFIFLLGILTSCYSQSEKAVKKDTIAAPFWTLEKAKKMASDFNSPAKWDTKTLEMEIENLEAYPPMDFPLYTSPFPTPDYESPGNGNGSIEIEIGGKKIIGQTVIIGRGEHSEYLFQNLNDAYITYFTILTIADGMDTENPVLATSRNHPHYLSQGSLNTSSKSRVDWVATQFADKNAYGIVNTRIFDLRIGRLILVAPQKDGSIRFYQTEAPTMNAEEREKFIENLKTEPKVIEFFNNENNI